MLQEPITPQPSAKWLLRISEVFAGMEADILRGLGAVPYKRVGRGYWLVTLAVPGMLRDSAAAKFVRWNLPLHHTWPCAPREMDGFVEKAAQALWRKFGDSSPQTVIAGALDPGDPNRYYRTLASNLRGRALQLFPPQCGAIRDAATQNPHLPTLFCLVGKEGLFCGVQSPAAANGFHPGGTKFIRQNSPDTISRAGAKIAEALHHLPLYQPPPAAGSHWLELGASPGGMTAELLGRGYRVTAVDLAPLDHRLHNARGLRCVLADAAMFRPEPDAAYEAILCDMNGDALESMTRVIRLAHHLRPGGLVVFTLKLPGAATFVDANDAEAALVACAAQAGLRVFARTHLSYNRHEFTLFFNSPQTSRPGISSNQKPRAKLPSADGGGHGEHGGFALAELVFANGA
jgi:SAM-dependent methyltransferase